MQDVKLNFKALLLVVIMFQFLISCKGPVADQQAEETQQKPNFLFLVFDDLGPHLSSYDDVNAKKFNLTPNFDALAQQGVQFHQAHAQVSVCGPSRASFLTGIRPDVTTVNTDHPQHWRYFPHTVPGFFEMIEKHPTLLNYFREKGYFTARSGKIHHIHGELDSISWEPTSYQKESDAIPLLSPPEYAHFSDGHGLPSFWQDENNPINADRKKVWPGKARHSVTAMWELHVDYDKDDPYRNRNALWVHRTMDAMQKAVDKKQPFFIACGIVANHDPYCQPKHFADLIDPTQLEFPETNGLKYNGGRPVPWEYYQGSRPWLDGTANYENLSDYLLRKNIPEKPWEGNPLPVDPGDIKEEAIKRKILHSYYASVAYSDYLLGKLLRKLEELNVDDNTVVVLISDHGFHIFDHDIWTKTTQFHHSTRSVAMIKAPMVNDMKPNTTFDQPVELMDFYPTMIALAGEKVPPLTQGKNLIPYLTKETRSDSLFAYSQFWKNGQMGYSIIGNDYRYTAWIKDPDGQEGPINSPVGYGPVMMEELYDLKRDAEEIMNVADEEEYQKIKARLSRVLFEKIGYKPA